MNKLLFTIWFATFSMLFIFTVEGQEPAQEPLPRMVLAPSVLNLYYHGKEFLTAEVMILNTGSAPLIIKHLKPSCQCLSGVVERGNVPPMGKGKIRLNINTHSVTDSLARVDLYIYSNQGEQPASLPIYLTKVPAVALPDTTIQVKED